jgi:hypothetical protein
LRKDAAYSIHGGWLLVVGVDSSPNPTSTYQSRRLSLQTLIWTRVGCWYFVTTEREADWVVAGIVKSILCGFATGFGTVMF